VLIVNNGSPSSPGATGSETIDNLGVGDTFIKVRVTSPDDSETADYDVTVTRRARVLSSDATLSAISAPTLPLDQEFKKDLFAYTATVANSVRTVAVTATATDTTGATVEVSKGDDTDGTYSLDVGDNEIVIKVTAEDKTVQLYTITITKLSTTGEDDATLVRLVINDTTETDPKAITLTPSFTRLHGTYTAEVSFDTTQLTADDGFTPNQSGTTIQTLIDSDNDGQIDDTTTNVTLTVGETKFIVRATTSTSPPASMDYNFTVTRLADVPSTVTTLSAITISADAGGDTVPVTLRPTFNKDTRQYLATVPFLTLSGDVDEVTVSATVTAGSGATVVVKLGEDTESPFVLEPGLNEIMIVVTAEDESTTSTYEIDLTRTLQSTDSTLSALELKDGDNDISLNTRFSASTESYTASVGSGVDLIEVKGTASHADATVAYKVNGGEATTDADDDGYIDIATENPGTYTIDATVTAEDGSTTRYRITVTRS
jgi:hypothetical protein